MGNFRAGGMEYVSVPLRVGDWEKIQALLKEDGYEINGAGIRDMLIDLYEDEDAEEREDESEKEKPLSPGLQKLFDYLAENPDAVKKAASLGKGILFSTLKKRMGL